MGNNLINAQGLLGKEVVALKDGSYLGKVQSIGIDPGEKKVIGVFIKLKGILSGKIFVPFSGIQAFGDHGITLKEDFDTENTAKGMEEKEILEMPVITINGTMLGKVDSFAFDKSNGAITEYILTEGLVRDTLKGKGLLRGESVSRIGKDVIIVAKEVDASNLEQVEMDYIDSEDDLGPEVVRLNVETEDTLREFKEEIKDTQESIEQNIEAGKSAAERGWQQTLQKVKKITEEWTEVIKQQADRVGGEAKELWSDAQAATHKQLEKINQVKEKWQDKLASIQHKKQDEFSEQLMDEIKDKTVNSPLYDDGGNPIILPGQIINNVIVKKAMEKGKLHQLFVLAATRDVEDQIEKIEK
ncbi:MAG: hypothetical protein VR72_07535 [Clostridiaceae bacterium BRH_c20a]|nr:MAG: hypothetical protein VR72_07535 [Clostridiaceae bacterium BRH_c20a]